MNALEICNLVKSFDGIKAVNDVSFSVPEGSVFGLIGRNGAGKTTTIRMMMNILIPESGEVILKGSKIGQEFRDRVGYLPEERGLYKKMKVMETLLYFAELKGRTGRDVVDKANYYLQRFQLADRKSSKIEDLSKGNQQKIQFITTILHEPEFIILDEPFSGLDPINTDLLREIIVELKSKGRIIIFSTHLMDFAEKMCDHIAMIDQGKIILNGSLSEIKTKYAKRNVSVAYQGDISFLKDYDFIENISDFGNASGIRVTEASYIQQLLKLLVDNNIAVTRFNANEISLHEIFVELAESNGKNNSDTEVPNV